MPHDVGHADEDGANHGHHPGGVRIVPVAHEVRHCGFAEFAQVRNHQRSEQNESARPSHEEFRCPISGGGDPARHGNESGCGHPVGRGSHPVRKRRHAPACDVVFPRGSGSGPNGDADVNAESDSDEDEVPSRLVH